MYKVYSTSKSNRKLIDKILSDDILGRQTVVYKEGSTFGLKDDVLVVLIEGPQEIFERVSGITEDACSEIEKAKSEEIYRKIEDYESEGDSGMGFTFE